MPTPSTRVLAAPERRRPFAMARTCSQGCLCMMVLTGLNHPFTDDNFRKGPRFPESETFHDKCNYCRDAQPIALDPNGGPLRCSRCLNNFERARFFKSHGTIFSLLFADC